MKKVLIITYYWPPASGPGVQRLLKFSKYLKDFNWEPVILTVNNGTYPAYDESLVLDIPKGTKVFKSYTFEPFNWYALLLGKQQKKSTVGTIGIQKKTLLQQFSLYLRANFFIPDARIGWYRFAIRKAKKIINEEKIDAIITTGPPHSTHLIGNYLKLKYHLPWVADMRDPWTTVFYNEYFPFSDSTKRKNQILENRVLKTADLVTVVSQGMKDEFSDRTKDICTIYNGFDEEDFKNKTVQTSSSFVITYTGNFKPNQNINTFWQSLSELISEIPKFKDHLKINLVGAIDSSILQSIEKYQLSQYLQLDGFLSHHLAIDKMMQSTVLLFIIPESERNHLIITGKLFEYLATTKPILAIGPIKGNAAAILHESGHKLMIDYKAIDTMKEQLKSLYTNWKNKTSSDIPSSNINRFSRKKLTEVLAHKLNDLCQ